MIVKPELSACIKIRFRHDQRASKGLLKATHDMQKSLNLGESRGYTLVQSRFFRGLPPEEEKKDMRFLYTGLTDSINNRIAPAI